MKYAKNEQHPISDKGTKESETKPPFLGKNGQGRQRDKPVGISIPIQASFREDSSTQPASLPCNFGWGYTLKHYCCQALEQVAMAAMTISYEPREVMALEPYVDRVAAELEGKRKDCATYYAMHGHLASALVSSGVDSVQGTVETVTECGQKAHRGFVSTAKWVWDVESAPLPRKPFEVVLGVFSDKRIVPVKDPEIKGAGKGRRDSRANSHAKSGAGGNSKVNRSPQPRAEDVDRARVISAALNNPSAPLHDPESQGFVIPESVFQQGHHGRARETVHHESDSEEDPDEVERAEKEHWERYLTDRFVVSEPPPNRRLQESGDLASLVEYEEHDQMGAPFCLMAAIDTACYDSVTGVDNRKVKEYVKYVFYDDLVSMDAFSRIDSLTKQVGTLEHANIYSKIRGVNIMIMNSAMHVIHYKCHCSAWKWVHLKYLAPEDFADEFVGYRDVDEGDWEVELSNRVGDEAFVEIPCGHFILMCTHGTNHSHVPSLGEFAFVCSNDVTSVDDVAGITQVFASGFWNGYLGARVVAEGFPIAFRCTGLPALASVINSPLFTAFTIKMGATPGILSRVVMVGALAAKFLLPYVELVEEQRVEFGPTYFAASDLDTRHVIDKKDRLVHQESYCNVVCNVRRSIRFGWNSRTKERLWPAWINDRSYFECYGWDCGVRKRTDGSDHIEVIEVERFKVLANDMAISSQFINPSKDLMSYSTIRQVNKVGDNPEITSGTLRVLKQYAAYLVSTTERTPVVIAGLVQHNVVGREAVVPNRANVVDNQENGDVHGGAAFVRDPLVDPFYGLRTNHVKGSYRLEPSKLKPVAVAPIGTLYRAGMEPVTAGAYCLSDSEGCMAAFMTRAMSKSNDHVPEAVLEYQRLGKELIDDLLDNSVLNVIPNSGNKTERNITAFIKAYTGKRPKYWIESRVKDYRLFESGRMKPKQLKKFEEHGFFVKFESNIKVLDDGTVKGRPRGIMTMSGRMLIELAPCIEVLHQLYGTKMKDFQIKNMTEEEKVQVIMNHSRNGCMVTDASAFESSVFDKIREVEDYCMKKLCERVGAPDLYDDYRRYVMGYRVLRTKWGVFACCTRDSGDFWTSAFNGIVMLTLVYYECKKSGRPFTALVEGDDGLAPLGSMSSASVKELGFSFSSELYGTRPGDVDFLKARWAGGNKYLMIGRTISQMLWIKKAAHLTRGKQLFLLRMAALSCYHNSPGHPVISALISRILRVTRHVKEFRGYLRYVDTWKGHCINTTIPDVIVIKEEMRALIAGGAVGFPPMPISTQLELERMFTHDDLFYVARVFDSDEEVYAKACIVNGKLNTTSTDFYCAIEESGISIEGSVSRDHAPSKSGFLSSLAKVG